ncbi:MAG: PilZ domain-containing protein [Deltaproteobacteria bacterium]|nr:PilZ domain-containing protein [Deltaproteobacteria bacterium]MBW2123084.1 PilZ domain-containing protein [Deltaproteobacteria bacterium]
MSEKDFCERRKYPRYPVSLNVSFSFRAGRRKSLEDRKISGKGRNISGRTGDISFEGLLVKATPLHAELSPLFADGESERPEFGVDLEIEADGKTIRAEGEMRWFKLWFTGQEPYQMEAGVFVSRMGSESRKLWDEFFEKLKL